MSRGDRPIRRAATTAMARRLVAALTAAGLGAAQLAAVFAPAASWRPVDLFTVGSGGLTSLRHVLVLAGATGLLAVAWGLLMGRRPAAMLAAGALCAAAAVHVAHAEVPALAALEGLLAAGLVVDRQAFPASGAGRTGRGLGAMVAGGLGASYGIAYVELVSDHRTGVGAAFTRSVSWLLAGGWWVRSTQPLALALDGLVVLVLVAGALLVKALLRPAEPSDGHSPEEHARAARVVARYARNSLDPFALREDKSFHFDHGGVLAYRTLGETAVVAGDPIGPPGSEAAILASFEELAMRRGWQVVLTGASSPCVDSYRGLGFRALQIGEEAVVDCRTFSLEGRRVRKVRQSVNRARRRGWSVDVVAASELTRADVDALAEIERAWRAAQPRLYGFAMTLGRLWGAEEDATAIYAVARDPRGHLRGFLRFARYARGLSLDVMRRSTDAPNGINEALIVAVIEQARDQGLEEVSLNFAGFAHVMTAAAELGAAHRLLRLCLRRVRGRFQLERLMAFNDQFLPGWRPRYLVYRAPVLLPLAGLRVLQAEAYVRPPRPCPRALRWQPLPDPVASATGVTSR
jgi:lysyl-tRNA synthetase class 2